MKEYTLTIGGAVVPVYRFHTLVIGSGAASLNAADRLHQYGITDLAIVTEDVTGGTSRNTGSDKQTYYKLAVASETPDSPYEMAEALYSGGSMHGDIALVEAMESLEAFYHLLSIGVSFPANRYGGIVGYKTDHDPKQRGTSIGPYTSKVMVECLLSEVERRSIPIFDKHLVVKLLVSEGRAYGAIAMDTRSLADGRFGLRVFVADNTVFGVGGPGGLYQASVYPSVHTGAIGLALEVGAAAVNLTESQYGLASTKFRWNVSGTYQQVIPRYISTNPDGSDPKEFLRPYFSSLGEMCFAIFLKGYQWPFDPRKIANRGSSLIDILVYRETVLKGRKVFLDYRFNPGDGDFRFEDLSEEAYTYLQKSDALFGLPLDRLKRMNPLAIELYRSNGIDLEQEPLEIAVCAQHNNGGLYADLWWESVNIDRLFPVGEVNGTHGVYRPGGSALNAGQVGSLRAAQKIAGDYFHPQLKEAVWRPIAEKSLIEMITLIRKLLSQAGEKDLAARGELGEPFGNTVPTPAGNRGVENIKEPFEREGNKTVSNRARDRGEVSPVAQYRQEFQKRMTEVGAHIRSLSRVQQAIQEALEQVSRFPETPIKSLEELPQALVNRHLVFAQGAYLSAIEAYLKAGGGSRGSYLVMDPEGAVVHPKLEPEWRYKLEQEEFRDLLLVTRWDGQQFQHQFVRRRPIPREEYWFETTWKAHREKQYVQEREKI
ncbi:MAG: FAD-binding protein [Spirochaetales bacterium]